jgi:hypothetical protein
MTTQDYVDKYGVHALVGKWFTGLDKKGVRHKGICLGIHKGDIIIDFTDEKGYPKDIIKDTINLEV